MLSLWDWSSIAVKGSDSLRQGIDETVTRNTIYKTLLIAAGLLGLYAAAGYLLVPWLAERSLPEYVQENLGANATVGKVRFDPFLLKIEADAFQLSAQSAEPVVAFDRLVIDLDLASIPNWAWTFGTITLDGLQVNAELGKDGRLNLAALADHWSARHPAKADEKQARAIIRRLKLNGATVAFTDLSDAEPAKVQSEAIDLEISDLATLPDREGRYVLSAKLPRGGEVSWRGELSLQPIASSGEWRLEDLRLATLWQFVRDEVRITEPQGTLSFAGRYAFRYENGTTALSLEDMTARVKSLAITGPNKRARIAFEAIEVSGARYDLAKRELVVPRLAFSDGNVTDAVSREGRVHWQEVFARDERTKSPAPGGTPAAAFHAKVETVAFERVALRIADDTRVKTLDYSGELNAEFNLDIETTDAGARLAIDRFQLALTNASVRADGADQTLAELKSVSLAGARLDTAARKVALGKLTVDGLTTAITHLGGGRVALIDAFSPAKPGAKPAPAPAAAAGAEDSGWSYALEAADISNVRASVSDTTYKPALSYDVQLTGSVKNVTSDRKVPLAFDATARIAQGGSIHASGTASQDFTQASAKINVTGLGAAPLRTVVAHHTTLDLKSGVASLGARIEYRASAKPALRVQANAKVLDLLLNETASGERFLSWKSLEAGDVALTMSPNRLNIKDVRVEAPGAKIAIDKDRNVNLTRVMKGGDAQPGAQKSEEEDERFPVRVARIAMREGTLDFSDDSLVLPFATRVTSFNGAIVGLSTTPRGRAELKLDGEIEPNGAARAEGALRPMDPKSFMDITVKFENVEMPQLSPYTATFAGRKIAAGRLWVEVQYKIADSQLLGENKITMADFQLGERVEAPNALDLPLDLAVALLKGPDGRIQLAVPVRGDLGNPKFEYGALIRDAIGNVLRRIVTAPFRFIAGLFGGSGGGDDLQNVAFDPGSARLLPTEREQLQKLSEALKGRSQLKLVIHGAYDPQRDARALRERLLRRELATELGIKLDAQEDPGPAALDSPDTQRALEKLMSARAGGNAVDQLAAEYAKKTGKEVQRVNPLLATFRRGRGDRDFYEALFDHLVQTQPLSDKLLTDLAAERARSISDFMAKTGLGAERIATGKPQTVEDGSRPPAARLTLEAA